MATVNVVVTVRFTLAGRFAMWATPAIAALAGRGRLGRALAFLPGLAIVLLIHHCTLGEVR